MGAPKSIFFVTDAALKGVRIFKLGLGVSCRKVLYSTARTHAAFAYITSFHLVCYYLILFLIFGLFYLPFAAFGFAILLFAALWDYRLKKPALSLPLFACCYALEHTAYQLGVFAGCLKEKTFMSYVPKFVKKIRRHRPSLKTISPPG